MRIARAQLRHFRNHSATEMEFGRSINVLLGDNGEGKTNVLEALSFLCLTKSFYAKTDSTVVQKGKDFFEVTGTVISDYGIEHNIRVVFDNESNEKRYFLNAREPERYSNIIGQFPIVVLSPENSSITFGSPRDRRKFTDLVIAQSSKLYLEELIEYRKVLRQRNKILSEAAHGSKSAGTNEMVIGPWNETLVAHGSRIVQKRAQFFQEYSSYITDAYGSMIESKEIPAVEYRPNIESRLGYSLEEIQENFAASLQDRAVDEYRTGMTLVGPHRDEIKLSINGLQLQHYASQGQHKTFLIALKMAEYFYLKERCSETPVFLLDDVFSELDERRSQHLLRLLHTLGQTFVTATNENVLYNTIPWHESHRRFSIAGGSVVPSSREVAA